MGKNENTTINTWFKKLSLPTKKNIKHIEKNHRWVLNTDKKNLKAMNNLCNLDYLIDINKLKIDNNLKSLIFDKYVELCANNFENDKEYMDFYDLIVNHEFSVISLQNIVNNTSMSWQKVDDLCYEYKRIHQDIKNKKLPEIKKQFDNFMKIYNKKDIVNSIEQNINNLDKEIKQHVTNKYYEIINLRKDETEYIKRMAWLSTVFKLPTSLKLIDTSNEKLFVQKIKKKLDLNLFGMESVKIKLLAVLLNYIKNPNKGQNNIALLGSPGIGKTKILKCLAECAGLPFTHISIGNLNNASRLTGSSYFYSSSKSGEIVESTIKMKYKNGIILLDEIDKVKSDEVLNSLLHICDPTQNSEFSDDYLDGISIDLSNYLFVFSLNDVEKLTAPLKSRLNIIKVKKYSFEEKVGVIKNFSIPTFLNGNDKIIFEEDMIKYIIKEYGKSSDDMRDLNNIFSDIIRSSHYYNCMDEKNFEYPITIKQVHLDKIFKDDDMKSSKYPSFYI